MPQPCLLQMRSYTMGGALLACRILNVLVTVSLWVTTPLRLVTHFVGGCLVSCTFGLLLLPADLVWLVLLGLLLATSWVWERIEVLRVPVLVSLVRILMAIIGIPLGLLSATCTSLVPPMGELESWGTKVFMANVWPFTLDYWRFYIRFAPLDSPDAERRYRQLAQAARIVARGEELPPPPGQAAQGQEDSL